VLSFRTSLHRDLDTPGPVPGRRLEIGRRRPRLGPLMPGNGQAASNPDISADRARERRRLEHDRVRIGGAGCPSARPDPDDPR